MTCLSSSSLILNLNGSRLNSRNVCCGVFIGLDHLFNTLNLFDLLSNSRLLVHAHISNIASRLQIGFSPLFLELTLGIWLHVITARTHVRIVFLEDLLSESVTAGLDGQVVAIVQLNCVLRARNLLLNLL